MKKKSSPTVADWEAARDLFRKLRLRISFPEKRWLLDAVSYEDYVNRLRELAGKHHIKV